MLSNSETNLSRWCVILLVFRGFFLDRFCGSTFLHLRRDMLLGKLSSPRKEGDSRHCLQVWPAFFTDRVTFCKCYFVYISPPICTAHTNQKKSCCHCLAVSPSRFGAEFAPTRNRPWASRVWKPNSNCLQQPDQTTPTLVSSQTNTRRARACSPILVTQEMVTLVRARIFSTPESQNHQSLHLALLNHNLRKVVSTSSSYPYV